MPDAAAPPSSILSAADIRSRLAGGSYAALFEDGRATVGWYELTGPDAQSPHKRDEFYMVAEGRGIFEHGEKRTPFGPGDLIFVPAGEPHRFTGFGERMAVWVVFLGPVPGR